MDSKSKFNTNLLELIPQVPIYHVVTDETRKATDEKKKYWTIIPFINTYDNRAHSIFVLNDKSKLASKIRHVRKIVPNIDEKTFNAITKLPTTYDDNFYRFDNLIRFGRFENQVLIITLDANNYAIMSEDYFRSLPWQEVFSIQSKRNQLIQEQSLLDKQIDDLSQPYNNFFHTRIPWTR